MTGLTYTHPDGALISRLVSPAGRLGAQILDAILFSITAGVGWLIWAVFILDRGQTPARQLLGHAVADAATGLPLGFGRMLYRELVIKVLLSYVVGAVTFGVYAIVDSLFVFGDRNRTLHDKIANSIVIHQ